MWITYSQRVLSNAREPSSAKKKVYTQNEKTVQAKLDMKGLG